MGRYVQMGPGQLRIMQVLWKRQRASAREITRALNRAKSTEIAHSTVQTLLRQLESKGIVSHEKENRTFVFFPLVDRENVIKSEIRKLKKRLFAGSAGNLMNFLLTRERISKGELKQIQKLIRERETVK